MRFLEELNNTDKATSPAKYIDLRTSLGSVLKEIRISIWLYNL